jgi:hypothetical protein
MLTRQPARRLAKAESERKFATLSSRAGQASLNPSQTIFRMSLAGSFKGALMRRSPATCPVSSDPTSSSGSNPNASNGSSIFSRKPSGTACSTVIKTSCARTSTISWMRSLRKSSSTRNGAVPSTRGPARSLGRRRPRSLLRAPRPRRSRARRRLGAIRSTSGVCPDQPHLRPHLQHLHPHPGQGTHRHRRQQTPRGMSWKSSAESWSKKFRGRCTSE